MNEPRIPDHIAIIMDGNNRWARKKRKPKLAGHVAGANALRKVIKKCLERGVSVLSVFAFSSENWKRPKIEVDGLMKLFEKTLNDEISELIENNISIEVIGDKARFSSSLQAAISRAEYATKSGQKLKLNVLANYGGQWDISDTARRLAVAVQNGMIDPSDITTDCFDNYQHLAGQGSVDLLIRTGGEQRISNFLLWQSAYAELVFSDMLWPDFDGDEMDRCLQLYTDRERRFGKTSDQLKNTAC